MWWETKQSLLSKSRKLPERGEPERVAPGGFKLRGFHELFGGTILGHGVCARAQSWANQDIGQVSVYFLGLCQRADVVLLLTSGVFCLNCPLLMIVTKALWLIVLS